MPNVDILVGDDVLHGLSAWGPCDAQGVGGFPGAVDDGGDIGGFASDAVEGDGGGGVGVEQRLQPDTQPADVTVLCGNHRDELPHSSAGRWAWRQSIPADVAEQIFVPFFTTKHEGSGIGLSLSRQIMKLSGGSITLLKTGSNGWPVTFQLEFD